jgi:hypothetical protein
MQFAGLSFTNDEVRRRARRVAHSSLQSQLLEISGNDTEDNVQRSNRYE